MTLWLALALVLCPVVSGGGSLPSSMGMRQLRALFVQRLVKYVSWPEGEGPQPGEPYIIAATDSKSLLPYFNAPEMQERFTIVQWPADHFHVLVVAGAPFREAAAILQRVGDRPVLTIGQSPYNLRQGVIINLRLVNGHFKLQVNPDAARSAGLTISSRLLQLATIYHADADD